MEAGRLDEVTEPDTGVRLQQQTYSIHLSKDKTRSRKQLPHGSPFSAKKLCRTDGY